MIAHIKKKKKLINKSKQALERDSRLKLARYSISEITVPLSRVRYKISRTIFVNIANIE